MGSFPINCSVREPLEETLGGFNPTNQAIQVEKLPKSQKDFVCSTKIICTTKNKNAFQKV
jgi:hypothetical protein